MHQNSGSSQTVLYLVLALNLVLCPVASARSNADSRPSSRTPPRLLLLDAEALARVKERITAGDQQLQPALAALRDQADRALKQKPLSVMDKPVTPPSGDKHDYMSQGTYWWPNPNTPDGLPYVRRDGHHNPEGRKLDSGPMRQTCNAVIQLALAYELTDHEPYAEHATRLLRVWFLDPATRMNPHLKYAQGIPGICEGRGVGTIDSRIFAELVDAVALLERSPAWTEADMNGFRNWCRQYLDFLLTSKEGRDAARQPNNIGTWYDVQTAALALFVGRTDVARKILSEAAIRRIEGQIKPDGRQPLELGRTKSYNYSCMNLIALMNLATLARHVGVDLWNHQGPDGRSIRRAVDWLTEHALEADKWEHQQIQPIAPTAMLPILYRAAIAYDEPRYEQLAARLPNDQTANDVVHLTYPLRK